MLTEGDKHETKRYELTLIKGNKNEAIPYKSLLIRGCLERGDLSTKRGNDRLFDVWRNFYETRQ